MNKLKISLLTAVTSLVSLAPVVYAVDRIDIKDPGVGVSNLGFLISAGIKLAMLLAVLIVFVYLVWGGFQWITSGGDKAAVDAAKHRLTAAIIGLAIIACAWAFILIVENFFGISIFGTKGFDIPSAKTGL